jgi:hypothetical protein
MNVSIKVIADVSLGQYADLARQVTLAYAQATQQELMEFKPPPPARGSMVYKSERQRRFVMANWAGGKGKLRIPYVRGTGSGLQGSAALNRHFRVDLEGDVAVLYSGASYAPYVIGDQQAQIHQGRWKTAIDAANTVAQRGDLDKIVEMALAGMEK